MKTAIAFIVLIAILVLPVALWWWTNTVATALTMIAISIASAVYSHKQKGSPSTGDSGLIWAILAGVYFIAGIIALVVDAGIRIYGG